MCLTAAAASDELARAVAALASNSFARGSADQPQMVRTLVRVTDVNSELRIRCSEKGNQMAQRSRPPVRGGDPGNAGWFSSNVHQEAAVDLSDAGPLMAWPAHTHETRSWDQGIRGGTREDRMLTSVTMSLPPLIAEESIVVGGELAADIEAAMREITSLDHGHAENLEPLGTMLLRTESVASSKIERIQADIDDYARALHGSKANASALSMVAATEALGAMIDDVGSTRVITIDTMTTAHRALMAEDPYERDHAGKLRTVQNWIGGSDHSPRGAMYVPPPRDAVEAYMEDLVAFTNRGDMPALAQAAIAHAQFESIHPFTDGNGRIGRALVNTVLRRRGATSNVVVPLASSLVARRDRYFETLNAYRAGDAGLIVASFAFAATIAATESKITAARLAAAPQEMADMVGSVRRGSAVAKLLAVLPSEPVLSAADASGATGVSGSSLYGALDRLTEAGVLRTLMNRSRNQVWGATLILDELEDLGLRIEVASR